MSDFLERRLYRSLNSGMDADEERAYLKRCADEQRAKNRKLARVYSQDDEPRIASNTEAQENQY